MCDGFLFSSTSSESRMGISHTHGHRGPHSGPKTTRDTPKVTAFCIVRLMMLAYDPPIRISSCVTVFCSHPPHLSLGWAYCTPTAIGAPKGHRGPHGGRKTTRDTAKVAAFCFVRLLMLTGCAKFREKRF